jgi:hypothetical protein
MFLRNSVDDTPPCRPGRGSDPVWQACEVARSGLGRDIRPAYPGAGSTCEPAMTILIQIVARHCAAAGGFDL